MAHHPFFRSNAGRDLVRACLRFSMLHKGTDVLRLLEQPASVIAELWQHTGELLDEMEQDRG